MYLTLHFYFLNTFFSLHTIVLTLGILEFKALYDYTVVDQAKAQFSLKLITASITRFYHMISKLPLEIVTALAYMVEDFEALLIQAYLLATP